MEKALDRANNKWTLERAIKWLGIIAGIAALAWQIVRWIFSK
jgi:hypothetical protein